MRRAILLVSTFALGAVAGGYFFSRSIPRSFLAFPDCGDHCLQPKDLLGLIASAGLSHAAGFVPSKVTESPRCVGISHWKPEGRYHVTYFPKRDARNILELGKEDSPFFLECLALAKAHVSAAGFQNYRFVSNGPALQHLTYFHFHVIAK